MSMGTRKYTDITTKQKNSPLRRGGKLPAVFPGHSHCKIPLCGGVAGFQPYSPVIATAKFPSAEGWQAKPDGVVDGHARSRLVTN